MIPSKIIKGNIIDIAAQYPIYSQDNKQGDALAWLKLIITGTDATYYILEAKQYGEYQGRENWELYGVCNMGGTFRYGYFCLAELEALDMYGGLVHVEAVPDFEPRQLSAIPEVVADLSDLWGRAKSAPND